MLPIHAVLDPLKSALANGNTAVLAAPPGAGKTTVVPLALLDQAWLGDGRVLVLEPRRIAARAAADRMAATLGQEAGGTVGYRTRLQSRIGPKTRLVAVTHMSNVLGTVNDIRAIADLTHTVGALLLVDGCQGAVHCGVCPQIYRPLCR